MRAAFAAALLAVALDAGAADRLDAFAYAIPVQAGPGEALQRLELPLAVYDGSVRPHLADLRVFNGEGEVVPFAFLPRAAPEETSAPPTALRYFPLQGATGGAGHDLEIHAQRSAAGTVIRVHSTGAAPDRQAVLAYLVDTSERKTALRSLDLDWKAVAGGFSGSLRVDCSDDLARWSTLVAAAPLLSLEYSGQRLERKRVELPGIRCKYLRLSWPAVQAPLILTQLEGRAAPAMAEPERRWKALTVSAGKQPGEYEFGLAASLPLDRLRLDLPEPNTLVAIELLTRAREQDPWRSTARAVVYRLTRDGVEVTSPPVVVQGGAQHWLLRVDQKGGGIGAGQPGIQAGWLPQELVFIARGAPPFQLAYGNAQAQPGAYAIQTIVPGWRTDEALKAAPASTGAQSEVAGRAALRERADYKAWMLWGALAAGVAVLAWMAWQLARQLKDGGTR